MPSLLIDMEVTRKEKTEKLTWTIQSPDSTESNYIWKIRVLSVSDATCPVYILKTSET
jgi:hypothetical protein